MSNSHHIITMATEELNGLPDVLKNIEETSNKVSTGGVANNNNDDNNDDDDNIFL